MNNNTGLIVGVFFSLLITFFQGNLIINNILESIGAIIGVLIINAVVTSLVCIFKKFDNFGKYFGQVSILLCLLTIISFAITVGR